jgi:hypothetical protein
MHTPEQLMAAKIAALSEANAQDRSTDAIVARAKVFEHYLLSEPKKHITPRSRDWWAKDYIAGTDIYGQRELMGDEIADALMNGAMVKKGPWPGVERLPLASAAEKK